MKKAKLRIVNEETGRERRYPVHISATLDVESAVRLANYTQARELKPSQALRELVRAGLDAKGVESLSEEELKAKAAKLLRCEPG